jgi:hypothetical protein
MKGGKMAGGMEKPGKKTKRRDVFDRNDKTRIDAFD